MKEQNLQEHWERIYHEKSPQDVSWTQERPEGSLHFIHEVDPPKDARIIDVGGGDSKLVDHLLDEGYENLSVLDLSHKALEKARVRLGDDADKVEWIASDVLAFHPRDPFYLWHDRATFHFLTNPGKVAQYVALVRKAVSNYMLIGTFSDRGPEKCSGLPVQRYDEKRIEAVFEQDLQMIRTWREDHITPDGKSQNFLFAGFRKKRSS